VTSSVPPEAAATESDIDFDALARAAGLTDLNQPTALGTYLRDLWSRREFAVAVPLGAVKARNTEMLLGSVWQILNPLFLVGVYYLLFGLILKVDRGLPNFLGFLAVGVFFFHFTQRAVMAATTSIVKNEGLVRSIRFPRAIMPLATVVEEALVFLPAVGVVFLVAVFTGEPVRATWLVLPAILGLQLLFNVGAGLLAARIAHGFRDFSNLLPYLFRLLFYMSGALYPVSRFIDDPAQLRLFDINPMYAFLTLARGPILGSPMPLELWLSVLAWTTFALVVGLWAFRRAEGDYGR